VGALWTLTPHLVKQRTVQLFANPLWCVWYRALFEQQFEGGESEVEHLFLLILTQACLGDLGGKLGHLGLQEIVFLVPVEMLANAVKVLHHGSADSIKGADGCQAVLQHQRHPNVLLFHHEHRELEIELEIDVAEPSEGVKTEWRTERKPQLGKMLRIPKASFAVSEGPPDGVVAGHATLQVLTKRATFVY